LLIFFLNTAISKNINSLSKKSLYWNTEVNFKALRLVVFKKDVVKTNSEFAEIPFLTDVYHWRDFSKCTKILSVDSTSLNHKTEPKLKV